MKTVLKTAFFPLGRLTFHQESAAAAFRDSKALLSDVFEDLAAPDAMLTDPAALGAFADAIAAPDLIVYQCTTFIGAEFVYELTRRFSCPIVIWSVREPSIDGGRLKLNSLTGAFSAANSVAMADRPFAFVFGDPGETAVAERFAQLARTARLALAMRQLVVGVVGSQPPGFGFGAVNESEIAGTFGIRIAQIEAAAIMQKAAAYGEADIAPAVAELKARTSGADALPPENLVKYARLRTAFQDFVAECGAGALASRCWPDFFVGFGAPVCAVLSMLNENGVPASCEADVGGAVTMFMGAALSGGATYFGDPVAVDEEADAIVYWHCGAGAGCLVRQDMGAKLGVHPNRKIGPTMEFGLKSGAATVLRLGRDKDGWRMFVMRGEALDEPQKFQGTSVTVRPAGGKAADRVAQIVADGWEPHFVVCYGDLQSEIETLCRWLGVRVCAY